MITQDRIGIEPVLASEFWRFGNEGVRVLGRLFEQLSPYRQRFLTKDDLLAMVRQGECFLAVDLSKKGHIVGMARLVTQGCNPRYGVIHDVVVDEDYRKHGIGKLLIGAVIALAKTSGLTYIELRSKRARTDIGRLCRSLGFALIAAADPEDPSSTNHYRLTFAE